MKILDVGQWCFEDPLMASLWRDRLGTVVARVAGGDRAKGGDR
jgi:hypothetical protein